MPKYVGVADIMLLDDEAAVKHAALLFDGVCLAATTTLRLFGEYIPNDKAGTIRKIFAMNDWLLENGIAVPAPPEFGSEAIAEELLKAILSEHESDARLRQKILMQIRGPEGPRFFESARTRIARRAARRLEADTGWETVVFGSRDDEARVFGPGSDAVAQVVLKSIPVPDDATLWEEILEYRNDAESRTRFLRLKHWINEAVAQNKPPRHLHDEIQTLLAEYEDHMKLHRLRIRTGAMETFVTTSAEVLEGLVRVKWSNAARALFSFRRRRIELLEVERQAPGRQLAYLADVRSRFGRKR